MKNKIFKIFCMMLFIIVVHQGVAKAAMIKPHAYAEQQCPWSTVGGYFFDPSGAAALHGGYSASQPLAFLTDEMWCNFNDDWIEIGEVSGSLETYNWSGHYTAIQDEVTGNYYEYAIGSTGTGNGNSFEIAYNGDSTWGVYLNNTRIRGFYMPDSRSNGTEVGIETNNTNSYFTNGIQSTLLKIAYASDQWENWYGVVNYDANSFGWTSNYSSSANSITFTN